MKQPYNNALYMRLSRNDENYGGCVLTMGDGSKVSAAEGFCTVQTQKENRFCLLPGIWVDFSQKSTPQLEVDKKKRRVTGIYHRIMVH